MLSSVRFVYDGRNRPSTSSGSWGNALTQPTQNAPSFRDRIADERLRTLYDYWLTRRGDRPLMLRTDFDPIDLPALLRHLILADVGDGGRAIRYRVVGTEIVAAHGLDYTGLTVEELTSGDTLAFTHALYGTVIERCLPVYSEGRFRWTEKEYRLTRRLHLPLSRDGDVVDMVLAGQVFDIEKPGTDEAIAPALAEEVAADRATLNRQSPGT